MPSSETPSTTRGLGKGKGGPKRRGRATQSLPAPPSPQESEEEEHHEEQEEGEENLADELIRVARMLAEEKAAKA